MIDSLLLLAADAVEKVDQRPGKDIGGLTDQLVACGGALLIGGLGTRSRLDRFFFDTVRIDGGNQATDDIRKRGSSGRNRYASLFLIVELPVETREPSGQRANGVLVACARHAHASQALDNGAPISLVQQTLGHGMIKTTSIYAHAKPGDSSALYLKKVRD